MTMKTKSTSALVTWRNNKHLVTLFQKTVSQVIHKRIPVKLRERRIKFGVRSCKPLRMIKTMIVVVMMIIFEIRNSKYKLLLSYLTLFKQNKTIVSYFYTKILLCSTN